MNWFGGSGLTVSKVCLHEEVGLVCLRAEIEKKKID